MVWLFGRADVVISGSFHGVMFACLAGTPALLLEGVTRKAEHLAALIDSPSYQFVDTAALLAAPASAADAVERLAASKRALRDGGGVMPRLRRAATRAAAPERLGQCLDMEALLPSTATLDTYWRHANFSLGKERWMGWNTCAPPAARAPRRGRHP